MTTQIQPDEGDLFGGTVGVLKDLFVFITAIKAERNRKRWEGRGLT